MHRKTTSRRESNRIESKRLRAAERQAINGGHDRIVRYDSWASKPPQIPLMGEICNGKDHKKKKQAKPVACPTGPKGKHEFLKDVGIFERYHYWFLDLKPKAKLTEEIRRYRMCVHCGKIQVKSTGRYGGWYGTVGRLIRSANDSERYKI